MTRKQPPKVRKVKPVKAWTKDDTRKAIRKAAESFSDLNVFYAIIALLEGGTIHAVSDDAASRIIAICKSEAGERLGDYDLAIAQANGD